MKKKVLIPLVALLIVSVLALVYYFTPKTFGKNVNLSDVDHINVFDGNTGVRFTADNLEDIQYIIENIQSHPMKREGVSFGRKGYSLKISYIDSNDKNVIPVFILNSDNTIHKDPFFYSCDDGLCFEYIKNLENEYSAK